MGKSTPQIQTRWRVCPHRSTAGCCPMEMSIRNSSSRGGIGGNQKYAPGDTVLEGLETEAREARKDLWADPAHVPPWEWRKTNPS